MKNKIIHTTSDYIAFETAIITGQKLLKKKKTKVMGLYIIASINLGLRVSDILSLTIEQLRAVKIQIKEKKTNKYRELAVNDYVHEAVAKFDKSITGLIFKSQKGGVFTTQQINRKLKVIFEKLAKTNNISSHSLRKGFGRAVYQRNNETEKALMYLSELFNHTSIAVTRKYLGIRQEELNNIYLTL
jgi:integrase